MKVLVVLAALVACALASGYGQAGFQHVGNGVAAPYRNADRQKAVNNVAHHVGAGTGTAKYYGVPGANGYFGYGGYNGYNGHHGYNGYNGAYQGGYYGAGYPGYPGYGYGYPGHGYPAHPHGY